MDPRGDLFQGFCQNIYDKQFCELIGIGGSNWKFKHTLFALEFFSFSKSYFAFHCLGKCNTIYVSVKYLIKDHINNYAFLKK